MIIRDVSDLETYFPGVLTKFLASSFCTRLGLSHSNVSKFKITFIIRYFVQKNKTDVNVSNLAMDVDWVHILFTGVKRVNRLSKYFLSQLIEQTIEIEGIRKL